MNEKAVGLGPVDGWVTEEEVLPDGSVRTNIIGRSTPQEVELRGRHAEAIRLIAVAGSSRAKLRVLTVVCTKDHNLINVYRIAGVLIWEGGSASRKGMKWPDGKFGKLGGRTRRVIVNLLDESTPTGNHPDQPRGNCPCGNFGVSAEWMTQQLKRDDLPASGRVVHVLPATRAMC